MTKKDEKNLKKNSENAEKKIKKTAEKSEKIEKKITKKVAEKNSENKKNVEKTAEKNLKNEKKISENSEKNKKNSAEKNLKKFKNPFSYSDPLQKKFVNTIMRCGKKTVAEKILKNTFEELKNRGYDDPLKMFETAIIKASPSMEVRPKRIGGAIYQIPIEVKAKRQQSLVFRWIIEGAKKRKGQPMFKKLAAEIIDAVDETGHAFGKKTEVHKMAQANKAFAHLSRY